MGDLQVEGTEQFLVSLSLAPNSPPGTTLLTPLTAGTVRNDDDATAPPVVSIADHSQAEGDAGPNAFTFTVTRDGDPTEAIGELRSGDDYARESVAIWRASDLSVTKFTIYIAGLSGEARVLKNPAYDPDQPETSTSSARPAAAR